MGPQLKLVVVGKNQEDCYRFVQNDNFHTLGHLVALEANRTGRAIAAIGNYHLSRENFEVFGLCHADTIFQNGALETFLDTAAAGRVCGMVGRDLHGNYVWSKNIGDPVDVSTLDCCSVFFRRDSGLRFDEQTFDGFHCYVEDLCLQAHAKGIPVVVPPAKASHLEESTRNPEWQAQYKVYRKRLADKWAGTVFQTT